MYNVSESQGHLQIKKITFRDSVTGFPGYVRLKDSVNGKSRNGVVTREHVGQPHMHEVTFGSTTAPNGFTTEIVSAHKLRRAHRKHPPGQSVRSSAADPNTLIIEHTKK